MVKLKVIKVRDVGKYLVKLIIVLIIIFIFTGYFCCSKNQFDINIDILKQFLQTGINIIETKQENKRIVNSEISSYEELLKSELGIISSVNNVAPDSKEVVAEHIEELEKNEPPIVEEQVEENLTIEVIESNFNNRYTDVIGGVQIRNETAFNLSEQIIDTNVSINKAGILIFHTHTCESYTATQNYNYVSTGNYRTTDLNFTVAKVGNQLKNNLEQYDYNVIHDETFHDYPTYSGSYGRSLITVNNLLKQNSNIDMAIDIHRDAVGDNNYAPKIKMGDKYIAQLMFVIGTNGGGLEHSNWQENLKFAITLQQKANEIYPGLFKPIILRNARYNQHLAKAACIIEVGATGNTLEECLESMKCLAKIINEL